ncbi:SusC/RagA family TonB-linked outer membrane protein [Allomuricauda sp. F6463D]|uniref:SusC/RagA family TonB-linked outer membrane protein n=1 Tax=Allomuricauda sp. F6463D TaxID=2926409 RepID=UPI001FF122A2|nr:TonB-dependent receptor [Muricauda sp. F6463D]MCK0160541.1 TonB-dependent receptor [Muricauda sp. F6463D]
MKKSKINCSPFNMRSRLLFGIGFAQFLFFFGVSQIHASTYTGDSLASLMVQQQITGTVVDDSGELLPGVNVLVKGTVRGTQTDFDGNYSIEAAIGDVLVFSYVGMKTQSITIEGDSSTIDVAMQVDAAGLDEVVVVGYGSRKKATLTGAVATVSGEELLNSHSANITTGLAGQVPGLVINQRGGRPGAENVEIFVRGKGTLGDANNSPLLVIDGVPSNVDALSRLNPNDIKSMSVLKDASAAIYGVNASNGVILIETKRGNKGDPVYSVSGTFSLTQPTVKPNWTNSYQTAVAMNEEAAYKGAPIIYSEEDLEKLRTGSSPLTHAGQDVDWFDEVFKDWAYQQRYNLSVRGGSEKIDYYFSGELLNQDGQYKESDAVYFKRYQIRSNLDFQASKDLKLSVDISANVSNQSQEQLTSQTRLRAKQALPETIFRYPNGLVGNMQYGYNPVIMGSEVFGYDRTNGTGIRGIFRYDYKMDWITKGLSFAGFARYSVDNQKNTNWLNTWNTYSYDENADEYISIPSGWTTQNPLLQKEYSDSNSSQLNAYLKYIRTFGDHSFDTFVGMEARKGTGEVLFASRGDYLTNIVQQISAGDEATDINSGSDFETSSLSYFGRFNYGYKDKYLIDLTFRADGSYKFPNGQKWGYFPAVSAAWRISEEPFFKNNIGIFNYFKIRGSWGRMGLDNTEPFQYLATYSQEQGTYRRTYLGEDGEPVVSFTLDGYPNSNITWEEQETLDIGVDLQLSNGLFSLTADYFKNRRTKILIPRNESVPDYFGITLPDENIGIVDSWGFDGDASFNKRVNEDFNFSIAGTFTYTKNKAVFLDEAAGVLDFQKKEGHPVDVIDDGGTSPLSRLILIADGLYQNQSEIDNSAHLPGTQPGDIKYVDQLTIDTDGDGVYDTADGIIDDQDRVRVDKPRTPEIVYGINLSAKYKTFDFVLRLQGQARAWTMVQPEMLRYDKAWFEGRWQEEGDNVYPKTYAFLGDNQIGSHNNDRRSTFWLVDASFLRVKAVELGYSLPQSFLTGTNIKEVRFFVSADNLFTFDNMPISRDVELDSWQSYEISRVISTGLSINF